MYLNHLENKHIFSSQNPYNNQIILNNRFIDDSFVLFNGTSSQLDGLLKYINNIHNKIKFTLDHEQSNSLNFLDITITKWITDSNTKYTGNPLSLTPPSTQNHSTHMHTKWLHTTHLYIGSSTPQMGKEDNEEEVKTIKTIVKNNGYKTYIIDDLIHKHKLYKTTKNHQVKINKYFSYMFNSLPKIL